MSYNYQTQYSSPNYTPAVSVQSLYGMARVIEGITIHWWGDPAQNPQYQGIVNYLCRAGGNTSAHFVATGTNRQVACLVSPGDVAWHSGSAWGNARTIGIELDPRARDEDYDVAAELIADIRSAYGDVPIYWHSYFSQTACPGVWSPERLDALSYTKTSHATDWGKGGNKVATPAPTPTPVPTTPAPAPVVLFKVMKAGKQVGAFSTEASAYKGYLEYQADKVLLNGVDVTAKLVALFTAPSPTTGQPDSGKPIVDKDDYEATKARLSALEAVVAGISNFLAALFTTFKK